MQMILYKAHIIIEKFMMFFNYFKMCETILVSSYMQSNLAKQTTALTCRPSGLSYYLEQLMDRFDCIEEVVLSVSKFCFWIIYWYFMPVMGNFKTFTLSFVCDVSNLLMPLHFTSAWTEWAYTDMLISQALSIMSDPVHVVVGCRKI